jgi:hypothetical protein
VRTNNIRIGNDVVSEKESELLDCQSVQTHCGDLEPQYQQLDQLRLSVVYSMWHLMNYHSGNRWNEVALHHAHPNYNNHELDAIDINNTMRQWYGRAYDHITSFNQL